MPFTLKIVRFKTQCIASSLLYPRRHYSHQHARANLTALLCILVTGLSWSTVKAQTNDPQFGYSTAAQSLVERVLPQYSHLFKCELIPSEGGKDIFEIDIKDGIIRLRGNDGVSQAMAFNWYLRYYAHASYDWQASGPLLLSGKPPQPQAKERHTCLAAERFFLNYCTFGYTFPFTDWGGWQRVLDWMAMNGVNRPLLQCGQEATWYRVWKSYGLDDEAIRGYFTGPAHLPFNRMSEIEQWGGPLPLSYIDGQMRLQIAILARARSLGMKPILAAFAGHVPNAIKALKRGAAIAPIGVGWGSFSKKFSTSFLSPSDPLFKDVQTRFLREQAAMYGTDHLYAADPFNEITPPSWEPSYLSSVSKSIGDSLASEDSNAIWYQMAWTFYHDSRWLKKYPAGGTPFSAMCDGVPRGKMVFLDYVGEEYEMYRHTENFDKAPFIWNYLANFGGCTYMLAPVERISDRVARVLTVPNCIGVGSTLEGLNTNPIAYELTLEQPWHDKGEVDVHEWCASYSARRGVHNDPAVAEGWKILVDRVLTGKPVSHFDRGSAVVEQPVLGHRKVGSPQTALAGEIPARPAAVTAALVAAADALLKSSPETQQVDSYQYDVVNVVRQVLAYQSDNAKLRMLAAYDRRDRATFEREAAILLGIIHDMDTLVCTRHEYLLGSWIQDARSWGSTPVEKDYYERNARQIITTWGGPGSGLTDYARREWSGLLATYYLPRWQEFVRRLDDSLAANSTFDQAGFDRWRVDFEGKWVDSKDGHFYAEPHGDPVGTSRHMLATYRP